MDNLLFVAMSIIMGLMLIYIGGVLLVTYLALAAVLYFMQPKFLYSPERDVSSTPAELGLDLKMWFSKAPKDWI